MTKNWTTIALLTSFLIASAVSAKAEILTLENGTLNLSFDTSTATFTVLDTRNGYTWRQSRDVVPDLPSITVKSAKMEGASIYARIEGGEHLSGLRVWLDEDEPATVRAEVESRNGVGYFGLMSRFPYPFTIEKEGGYVVQCTTGDGVIFGMDELDRANDLYNFYGGMPWYGVTDLKKGCIGVLESFEQGRSVDQPTAKFPMQIRYHFTTDGGYVSLAQYYRRIAQGQGKTRTLAEKTAMLPQMAKFVGAPIIYLWGDGRSAEMIHKLKDAGIENAMVLWDLNHPPGPDEALVQAANEAGYLCGPYDIYLAIMNPATGWDKKEVVINTDRRYWSEGWPEALINYVPGVKPPETDTAETAYVCSTPLVDWARARIAEELRHFDYSIRFFDTMIPQVRACDSPLHPLDLEESRAARREILRYALEDMNQIIGSGEGYSPDWAVPVLCWMEGAMSMRYYTSGYTDAPPGDFINEYAPTKLLSDHEPDESFWDFEVNPARRLPLYGLVYHDCIATTWNWRGANHRWLNGGWRAKDLMNMLFANKPLWSLSPEVWDAKKDELIASYKMFSPWLEKVEFDEMTGHGWLSDDHKVATTTFSSGWHIAVNFTDQDFTFDKGVVKAMDYLTWKDE